MSKNLLIVPSKSRQIVEQNEHARALEAACPGGKDVFYQTEKNTSDLKRLLTDNSYESVVIAFLDFLNAEFPEVQTVRSLALNSGLVLYYPELSLLKLGQQNISSSELVNWYESGKTYQLEALGQADLIVAASAEDKAILAGKKLRAVTREELLEDGAGLTPRPKKKVSIVMLTFNQLSDTRLSVESLEKNTACDYELIFVDNGSTDDTRKYLENLKAGRKNIKTIFNDTNVGFSRANNQGIALAEGEYVLLLNNDVVLTEGWLERLLACAESSAAIGIVGPCTNHAVGEQVIEVKLDLNIEDINRFACMQLLKNAGCWFDTHRIIGFCVLVKREVLDKIGLLDERFGPGGYEDFDFCLRVKQAGYKIMVASDVFVYHIGGQGYKKNNLDYDKLRAQNIEIFIDKWCRKAIEILDRLPNGM